MKIQSWEELLRDGRKKSDKELLQWFDERVGQWKRYATFTLLGGPLYVSTQKVALTGEALSEPIMWTGRQWAVTKYGIEARDGTYVIERDRVEEDDWIEHMSEKNWIDLGDFAEALRLARMWFRYRGRAKSPV